MIKNIKVNETSGSKKARVEILLVALMRSLFDSNMLRLRLRVRIHNIRALRVEKNINTK